MRLSGAEREGRVSLLPTIERTRLLGEFRSADPRVVKIFAPAGYGKTTLAAALAKPIGTSARCDCLHLATPIDLVRGVLEAVGSTSPAPNRRAISDAFITLGNDESEWLRYARRVFERERQPAVLIFDNGEALRDRPDVRRSIERLVTEFSPNTRIVFCSRVDLPLNFARFAGPERTMRLGPGELRFDRGEIALLLARVGASSTVIARVEAFTQGWPMLVMMLFVLAKRGRLGAYLSGNKRDVNELYGYLVSEVLATLEPRARDLLETVVALPNARRSDLEALYGNATQDRIAELELATPFLSRTQHDTLEIHPAIGEMLRAESLRGIERAREIVDILAGSEPVRAARIAAHLGEYDRAAALLENARYFLRTPSLDLVDVLYALPPEALIRYPAVWNVASYSRALTRDASEWLHEAGRVWAAMPQTTPLDVRVELFSGFMNVYTQRGEFAKARALSAAFARTPAGEDAIGQITIRFWELVASSFLGGFVDPHEWEREVGPMLRVKNIAILLDYDTFARHERLAGDPVKERAILARAVEEARSSGDILLRYLTLTEAVFGAWFWGDDSRFTVLVDEFEHAVHPATERATSLLLAACRGRAAAAKPGTEQLKVRTYAYLIGAANERNLARRRQLLSEAVLSADQCAQPFTAAIARVALGVADPARAQMIFEEARSLAARTWSSVFQAAVADVRDGRFTGHMLAAFVKRYRETVTEPAPIKRLSISLITGTVTVDGSTIVLSSREYELLVYLALRDGPVSSELLGESLWPESDADHARSTLKVTLSRLRSRLGDPSLIAASPRGYALAGARHLDIEPLLKRDGNPSLADVPAEIELDVARERLSRWGWAKPFARRIAEFEALSEPQRERL